MIRKVKMKTEIRLLRWGQLPAQVGRRINTNKEKVKTLKKKKRKEEVLKQHLGDIRDLYQGAAKADSLFLWTDAYLTGKDS